MIQCHSISKMGLLTMKSHTHFFRLSRPPFLAILLVSSYYNVINVSGKISSSFAPFDLRSAFPSPSASSTSPLKFRPSSSNSHSQGNGSLHSLTASNINPRGFDFSKIRHHLSPPFLSSPSSSDVPLAWVDLPLFDTPVYTRVGLVKSDWDGGLDDEKSAKLQQSPASVNHNHVISSSSNTKDVVVQMVQKNSALSDDSNKVLGRRIQLSNRGNSKASTNFGQSSPIQFSNRISETRFMPKPIVQAQRFHPSTTTTTTTTTKPIIRSTFPPLPRLETSTRSHFSQAASPGRSFLRNGEKHVFGETRTQTARVLPLPLPTSSTRPRPTAAPLHSQYQSQSSPSSSDYRYQYSVSHAATNDVKSHKESREGKVVLGEYSVLEPDGYTRIVKYSADASGFKASVKRVRL